MEQDGEDVASSFLDPSVFSIGPRLLTHSVLMNIQVASQQWVSRLRFSLL